MYRPTREESRAKAQLLRKFRENPLLGDLEQLSIQQMERMAGVKDLDRWMAKEGFREWLLNDSLVEELMEADLELGMDRLREMLCAPMDGEKGNPKPGDITKAVELLLKYTGREPKKQVQAEYKDAEIAQMDEEQLDKMIHKALKGQKKITEDLQVAVGD